MHIGLDMLLARWTRTGMHNYLTNLDRDLRPLIGSHRFSTFLYGHPRFREPEHVRDWPGPIRYEWDCPPLRLAADRLPCAASRLFDRRFALRAWRKWSLRRRSSGFPPLRGDTPDLFHHVAFRVYPLHRINVYTLPDLGTLGEPDSHPPDLAAFIDEGLPLAHAAELVLVYSEHTRRDAAARLGLDADRIRVTPLAADPAFRPVGDRGEIRGVVSAYGLDDRPYFLAVGRLEARKNLVRAVEAMALFRRANPEFRHRLVLAGERAWNSGAVFAAIEREGLSGEVRHLDFVTAGDLPALVAGAEALIHPSLYEGFGLPPLEAMACGTPVIAADATALPELVGDAGVLVDPHDAGALAAAMVRVATDADLRRGLVARGFDRARQYTWEMTARSTLAVYEEAMRMADRPRPPLPKSADRARAFWRRLIVDDLICQAQDRLNG